MKRQDVFRRVEPPPGGPALLRRRLAEERERSFGRRALWILPAAAVAAALVLLVPRSSPELERASRGLPEQVARRLGTLPEGETVVVQDAARGLVGIRQVPTGNPNVGFYLVASLEDPEAPPGER